MDQPPDLRSRLLAATGVAVIIALVVGGWLISRSGTDTPTEVGTDLAAASSTTTTTTASVDSSSTSTTSTSTTTTTTAPTTTSSSPTTTEPPMVSGSVTCENGVVVSYEIPADMAVPSIDDLCSDVDDGEPSPLLEFCSAHEDLITWADCGEASEELFLACLDASWIEATEQQADEFIAECLVAGEELLADEWLFGNCGAEHYPVVTDEGTVCEPFEQPDADRP